MNNTDLSPLTDDMIEQLMQLRFSGLQPAARDSQGRLREITAEETAFGQILRAEAERRGLR